MQTDFKLFLTLFNIVLFIRGLSAQNETNSSIPITTISTPKETNTTNTNSTASEEKESIKSQYPFLATIKGHPNVEKEEPHCGAIILSPNFLLTTAECISVRGWNDDFILKEPKDYFVEACSNGTMLSIKKFHLPPSIKISVRGFATPDLGIVELENQLKMTKQCQPAPLPKGNIKSIISRRKHMIVLKQSCETLGWNASETVKDVTLIRLSVCNVLLKLYDENFPDHSHKKALKELLGSSLCSLYQNSSCGGLLICQGEIWGLTGAQTECSNPCIPNVYNRLEPVIPWIRVTCSAASLHLFPFPIIILILHILFILFKLN